MVLKKDQAPVDGGRWCHGHPAGGLVVATDGGSNPEDTSKTGWGVIVVKKTTSGHPVVVAELFGPVTTDPYDDDYYIGSPTKDNDTAEMEASYQGLLWLWNNDTHVPAVIISDSSASASPGRTCPPSARSPRSRARRPCPRSGSGASRGRSPAPCPGGWAYRHCWVRKTASPSTPQPFHRFSSVPPAAGSTIGREIDPWVYFTCAEPFCRHVGGATRALPTLPPTYGSEGIPGRPLHAPEGAAGAKRRRGSER